MASDTVTRRQVQNELLAWFERLMDCGKRLPEDEMKGLHEWDAAGNVTSEWPGWEKYRKYIGEQPTLPEQLRPKPKLPIPKNIRWQVWERDDFRCQRCGTRRHLSVDHIKPESAGGTHEVSNLQTLCSSCNSSKGYRRKYAVIFEISATGCSAYVPDLPGCVAAAKEFDETNRLIREAIEEHLGGLRQDGDPIPEPTCIARNVTVGY